MNRVLLVDDQPEFRLLARLLLTVDEGFLVVAEAAGGQEAVQLHRHLLPNLVLMDVQMAQMDGLEACRRIRAEFPAARVVLISMNDDPALHEAAAVSGALGFIAKRNLRPERLRGLLQPRPVP